MSKDTKKYYCSYAECTNTLRRYAPGCKKYRMIYGKPFVRLRRYVDPRTGEKCKTVEIEI